MTASGINGTREQFPRELLRRLAGRGGAISSVNEVIGSWWPDWSDISWLFIGHYSECYGFRIHRAVS